MDKKVKITKCSKEIMWYRDYVGMSYIEKFVDDNGDSVVYLNDDETKFGSILKGDYKYE